MASFLSIDGMESQTTLVDIPVHGTPQTVISFTRNDMKNTRIYSADERLLYTVVTDKLTDSRTMVYRSDTEEIVALIKRKELRADRVKFGNRPSIKLAQWLHGSNGKWTDYPCMFDWNGKNYIWKTNESRQIALYSEDNQNVPIAWFQTSTKKEIDGVPIINRALIALMEPAQQLIDAVVVSLLVVEHALRMREKNISTARADITDLNFRA